MIKPASVEYIDRLMHAQGVAYSVEELPLLEGSVLRGQTIAEAKLRDKYGALVIGIERNGTMIASPSAVEVLLAGDVLIVYGKTEAMPQLEKVLRGENA